MQPLRTKRRSARFNAVIRRSDPYRRGFVGRLAGLARRIPKVFYFVSTAFSIALVGLVYTFVFSNQFVIADITVSGTEGVLKDEVTRYIEESLAQWRFFIVQQNKTILFPDERLSAGLQAAFPDIGEVDVSVEAPHTLSVTIAERQSDGIWCAYERVTAGGVPACYFYDEQGVIYDEAPNAARGFLITVVRDERATAQSLGTRVLDAETLSYVGELTAALARAYVKPRYLVLAQNGEVRAGFGDTWEAYFARTVAATTQADALGLVLQEEVGSQSGELEYVDVRLGNKVFYKYREREPAVLESKENQGE
jgi:cell division septal protein FtsQ